MAGHEVARFYLGYAEISSGNIERAIKHLRIAASTGHYLSMYMLQEFFVQGQVSRESMDSTLAAYNSSCAEMRSKDRDAVIRYVAEAD